jgi:hypothetical protein
MILETNTFTGKRKRCLFGWQEQTEENNEFDTDSELDVSEIPQEKLEDIEHGSRYIYFILLK